MRMEPLDYAYARSICTGGWIGSSEFRLAKLVECVHYALAKLIHPRADTGHILH
jgi:hypothetical protein